MATLFFILVTAFCLGCCTAQNNMVDPATGKIEFESVPTSNGDFVAATYEARGLDGYYAMANGFVDLVRSGSLPYDELIIPEVTKFYRSATVPGAPPYAPDASALADTFLKWYAGVLAVTILGFVLAFCIPVACCCVCTCRLCNQCGGNLNSSIDDEDKERSRRICCIVNFGFLLVFLALVSVGMVFSFLTNEAVQVTINSAVPTVLNSVDNVQEFVGNTLTEAQFLAVDQLNFTVNLVVSGVTDLNTSVVNPLLDMNRPALDSLLAGILSINGLLMVVGTSLTAVTSNVTALNTTVGSISGQVDLLRNQLTNLTMDCTANPTLNATMQCDRIPDPTSIQTVDVSTELDDVLMTIDTFRDALSVSQNITDVVNLVNDTVNGIPDRVQNTVGSQTSGLEDTIGSLSTTVSQALSQARTTVDDVFNGSTFASIRNDIIPSYVSNSDVPYSVTNLALARYIVGILFCVITLLVILCVALGLICGLAGFKKNALPFERSSLSNCGGICLLASAAFIFLAAFILLILAAIMFPFGTTLRKICLSVQNPDYEMFGPQLLTNPNIFGDPALGSIIAQITGDQAYANLDVDIQGIFRGCADNQPLYSAVGADNIINDFNITIQPGVTVNIGEVVNNPTQLLSVFNISLDQLTDQLNQQISSVNLDNIIPTDSINELVNNLPNVSAIDATANIVSVRTLITNANTTLETARDDVTSLKAGADMEGATAVVSQIDAIVMTINDTQALLNTASMELDDLNSAVIAAQMEATNAINSSQVQINVSISNATDLIADFNTSLFSVVDGLVNTSVAYIDQFVEFVVLSLRTDAIRCGPLSNALVEPLNLVCRNTVNSVNGFWFAIGWCALFFIPLVASVIALSKHFRRHRDVDEILRNPDYDGGYQMETYYNPSAPTTLNGNHHAGETGADGTFKKAAFDDSYPLFEDPRSGASAGPDYWIANNDAPV
nr:prominin 1-like protein [Halisarca dujardinii]